MHKKTIVFYSTSYTYWQRRHDRTLRNPAMPVFWWIVSLTDKECSILQLLNTNFGELTSPETLMQVWINEGVITGRSLDMFISKLRKKLSGDSQLSITNIQGKGYKLEALYQ